MLNISKMLLLTGSILFGSSAFAVCKSTDINGTWRFFIFTERFLQGANDEGGHRHEFARCRLIVEDGSDPADPIKIINEDESTCTGFNISNLLVRGSWIVQTNNCLVRGFIDLITEDGIGDFRLQSGTIPSTPTPGRAQMNIDLNDIAGTGQITTPPQVQGDPQVVVGKFSFDAIRQ
jgi:hypothetical protein